MESLRPKTADGSTLSLFTSKPLVALAIAAFGIGTSEYIIMGLLPNLARDFNVSIPKAGALVSGYALSVTIGSPILALAVARLERKLALLLLMGVFILGNLACALAPTYGTLFAARILTALCHGAFFGMGSVVASNIVARNQRAQAIALMFSGLTLANVLGVPAGTALGQVYGWRAPFWAILPIALLAAASIFFFLPRQPATTGSLVHEFRVLRKPQVLLVLGISTLASSSLFCVFTYIAPTLLSVTKASVHTVTLTLLLFGVGITIGNLAGGALSDRQPTSFLLGALATLIGALIVLYFAEPYVVPAVIMVLLWGAIHFAAGSPLQSRIVDKASDAPNLASTLNQGAFNLGNAVGATVGGMLLTAGFGYHHLPIASAVIALLALSLALVAARLDRKHRDERIAEELSIL
jgi:MFS transporter, DHA1 family, inner membrane transport protein